MGVSFYGKVYIICYEVYRKWNHAGVWFVHLSLSHGDVHGMQGFSFSFFLSFFFSSSFWEISRMGSCGRH